MNLDYCFEIFLFNIINDMTFFPLWTTLTASHKFCCIVFSFLLSWKSVLIPLRLLFDHGLFKSMLFNFQVFGESPVIFAVNFSLICMVKDYILYYLKYFVFFTLFCNPKYTLSWWTFCVHLTIMCILLYWLECSMN